MATLPRGSGAPELAGKSPQRSLTRPVSRVMTGDVYVIPDSASVAEAEQMLLRRGVHGAPVVDERGRLVGIVSQTDLLAWHAKSLLAASEDDRLTTDANAPGSVRSVMTSHAHAVRSGTSTSAAAALMIRRRIHRLLVVDRDLRPVGIVSAFDLLSVLPGVRRVLDRPEH